MSIKDRVQAPTPPFYRKLRNAGLAGVAIATSLLAASIGVPVIVRKIAGYLVLIAVIIYIAQIFFSKWWLARYYYGPVE